MTRRIATALLAVVLASALAACGSSGGATADRERPPPRLRVLVTNDAGYAAPGIDAAAAALAGLPRVQVMVVAPAAQRSGSGAKTTTGALTASSETTASGIPATAVDGYPADTIRYALDTKHVRPDVVVAGIHAGQNLGSLTEVSGTVGAARAAADRGIPAIAASQGLGSSPKYAVAARLVRRWIVAHRVALVAGHAAVGVVNLNVPNCPTVRGVTQVALADTAEGAFDAVDCSSDATNVDDDIAAFRAGYASVTQLNATGSEASPTTTFPAGDSTGRRG